ncbi:MAG: protease modulator HflC [Candidatus Acidiferrum sp.]
MNRKLIAILCIAFILILARLSLFTVDRAEFVYLTQFGRPVATFDGAMPEEAGLHLRLPWPIQSIQRLDRRLQFFDLPGAELLTRDPVRNTIDKTLTIDAYVCWRIAADEGGVDRFIRSVGTTQGAQAILSQRITSELGAAVGALELDDLISAVPGNVDAKREAIRHRLLDDGQQPLRESARRDYGIEVVDVRLRRTNHPAAVRQAIFDRIVSEREKKVADYRSEGERRAADIKSTGERKVAELRSQADAESIRQRGLADAQADRIRNEAAIKDPQFYAFLRKLEEYQRILGDNKTMLLLSTHRELFDTLFNPPTPAKNGAK